jgi:hypothetical protein
LAITGAGTGPPVSGASLLGLRPISLVAGVGGVGWKLHLAVDVGAGDEVGFAGDNRDVAVERAIVGLHYLDVHGLHEKSGILHSRHIRTQCKRDSRSQGS